MKCLIYIRKKIVILLTTRQCSASGNTGSAKRQNHPSEIGRLFDSDFYLSLRTSLFKRTPDYDTAASEYNKAGKFTISRLEFRIFAELFR
jgi:hypothetical protein